MYQTMTGYKKINNNTYEELIGPGYNEIEIGKTIIHRPGRTITESDCILQSLLNMNPHPIHIDNRYAKTTQFKQLLVPSPVTLSIITGMTVRSTSGKAIANLGWKEINLTAPIFIGDTIYAKSTFIGKRDSNTNKENAIITLKTIGFKNDGEEFMDYERVFLIRKREL